MKKRLLAGSVGVAAVWFVTHAGGGFCTGRQEVEFFVQFGWSTRFMPFVSMAILAAMLFIGFEMARRYGVYHYRVLADKLYQPHQKILGPMFEMGFLFTALLAASAGIAAGGHLLHDKFAIPYLAGITVTCGLVLILVVWGAQIVRRSSAIISLIIIATMLMMLWILLPQSINASLKTLEEVSQSGWAWKGFLYACFQAWGLGTYISVSEVLKTRTQVITTVAIGFAVNSLLLFLICLVLAAFQGHVINEPLPLLWVIEKSQIQGLVPVYALTLFLGNVSTAVVFIFGVVKRFESLWTKGHGVFEGKLIRRLILAMGILILAWCISSMGLVQIIAKGYGFVGYLAIPLILIPLLVGAWRHLRKTPTKIP